MIMVQRNNQIVGNVASGVALMLVIVSTGLCQAVSAQDTGSASADTVKENTDYRKKSLNVLRREFNEAEENFYDLFNEINSSDDFDVDCKNEVPLGGRRKVHACKADFLWRYEADQAAQYSNQISNMAGGSALNTSQVEKKQEQLRNEISSAITEYPELKESFAILVKAKKDYDAKQADR